MMAFSSKGAPHREKEDHALGVGMEGCDLLGALGLREATVGKGHRAGAVRVGE